MAQRYARSLGIRHLVCGSCNGCEHEMTALEGPAYDITQHGWEIVASPRHADVITATGPMSAAMRGAAAATVAAAPRPCVVVAVGDCAVGCGPWSSFGSAGAGAGGELEARVEVRGCPPAPDAIVAGLRRAAELLDAT